MTGQSVGGAVAVRNKETQIVDWIRRQQDDIAMAAASHIKPSAIIRVTQGALRRNDKLMAAAIANPQSLLYALLDCARLGHEPDTDDYYLVPFGNEVTGIEGYKGIIERMYRAGGVSSVVAQVVRQRDRFRARGQNTPPEHDYDPFASEEQRGPLRGVYAYAIFPDGRCSQVVIMGREEVMKHKAMSKGAHKDDSPWNKWEESMWKKCPLRGLEPYVPTSTEYREIMARTRPELPVPQTIADVRTEGPGDIRHAPTAAAPEPDIVEAELVDEPQQQAEPERPGRRASAGDARPTPSALGRLGKALAKVPLGAPDDVAVFLAWAAGRADARALEALTRDECAKITKALDGMLAETGNDGPEAASRIWAIYAKDHPAEQPDGTSAQDDDQAQAGSEASDD